MADEQPQQQKQQQSEPTYVPTTVAPSVAGEIMRLTTPEDVQNDKWEHNTKDLALANFNEIDINVMKSYVDLSFLNDFRGEKIGRWDSQKVERREERQIWIGVCDVCGFMTRDTNFIDCACPICLSKDKEAKNKLTNSGATVSIPISTTEKWKLWGKDKSMVFIQSTNARNGFRFRGLTEQHGYMKQDINQTQIPTNPQAEVKKKRKRFVLF